MNTDRSAKKIFCHLNKEHSTFWEHQRKARALSLFRRASKNVPAYRDFLHRSRVNPQKITTFADFAQIPPINKKNYLREYSLEELSWGGTLKRNLVFTATSGSTGQPYYFPRSEGLDWQGSLVHEMFIRNNSTTINGPTLVLVCFGMGVWIGGNSR